MKLLYKRWIKFFEEPNVSCKKTKPRHQVTRLMPKTFKKRMISNHSHKKILTGNLKIIGIISMAFDHVGSIFWPDILIFRIIGRLALPIFAYGISQGYTYTSDLKKYAYKILIFSIIAQIPYILLFGITKLNILFTLALALLFIYFIDKKQYIVGLFIVLLVIFFPFDYGLYGILMSFIFYYLKNKKTQLIGAQILITAIYSITIGVYYQLYTILGVLLVLYFPKDKFNFYLNKYFFYWFYPAHLALLYLIKITIWLN